MFASKVVKPKTAAAGNRTARQRSVEQPPSLRADEGKKVGQPLLARGKAPGRASWDFSGIAIAPPRETVSRGGASPVHNKDGPTPTGEVGSIAAPRSVHEVLRSPGQPLDPGTRGLMESRFGHDFSGVRVHRGPAAEQSARDTNSDAYTVRQNIVFGAGRFAPHQPEGRKLLAHELAHVVQQDRRVDQAGGPKSAERDAEDAASSVSKGTAPVVRTGARFGTIQRQPATGTSGRQVSPKKSRLIRVERYWGSPSARAFFEDGSNEEVTFIGGSSLDPAAQPEGTFEKELNLIIDRSSPIRPHVEPATHGSGSKVKVVTRLAPANRIAKLPSRVRGELSEGLLGDPESESDPQAMEFAADMGEKLKETSTTSETVMEGRDPATVAVLDMVDQWVDKQQGTLKKVGSLHIARFTKLLSDIRRIGVTGQTASEDLNAQDVELVLAGAAGGQSEFQTFDDFKRAMNWKLRSGKASLPEGAADDPEFYLRNDYRKAWKAEADGLRKMSRIAAAAQAAPFIAIGASAAVGTGIAGLEAGGTLLVDYAGARGVSASLLGKYAGTSLLASSVVSHFGAAREEAKAAGIDPNSPLGIANTASAALLRASGIGELGESITNKSIQTGQDLDRSGFERFTGGVSGALATMGNFEMVMPEAPGGAVSAADSSAAKAGTTTPDLPNQAANVNPGRFTPSAELNVPGPHPFFKDSKLVANENLPTPAPQAQVAEVPLASTGTEGLVPAARVGGNKGTPTGTGASGTKMSGAGKEPQTVEDYWALHGKKPVAKPGESGLKNPPKPQREITAAPKERDPRQELESKVGPTEDSPEASAVQPRRSHGGGTQGVGAEVGNFAHNSLPGYLDKMREELAAAKSATIRAKLTQQIAELEKMTDWPAGVEPNRLSFPMSDGRPGIPDGIDVENGIVYELKPNTESEWAQRGQYQASEYAAKLNEMKYAGRTDWKPQVIYYNAEELTARLRNWGVLPPKKK